MKSQFPVLRSERLILRPFLPEDALVLHRIYQTEGVLRYFPNPVPPPLEKMERFVLLQDAHWEKYGYGNWGILPKGLEEIIGWVGLQYLPELGETEVGFLLDKPFWGKGYATEAARASLGFGFENFTIDHIIALVHPENFASRHVVEKCGLAFQECLSLWGISLNRFLVENPSISHDKPEKQPLGR